MPNCLGVICRLDSSLRLKWKTFADESIPRTITILDTTNIFLTTTNTAETVAVRASVSFNALHINWNHSVVWSTPNISESWRTKYSPVLQNSNDYEIAYLLETFPVINQSLFSVINTTDGSYIDSRFVIDGISSWSRMLDNSNIIYVFWYNGQNVFFRYSKTFESIISFYKISDTVSIYDMGDLYNYGNNINIVFVGNGVDPSTVYIAKAVTISTSTHVDIEDSYDSSFASITSEFLTENYDISIIETTINEEDLQPSELSLSIPNTTMPGTSTVALYLISSNIADLEFGNQYTENITYTWALNTSLVTIQYEVLDTNNEVVTWATFDPISGTLTMTPLAYNEIQNITLRLKSTMNYSSSDLESSNNPVYKNIYVEILAAGWQVDNCTTCQTSDYATCEQWDTGFSISHDSIVNSLNITTSNSWVQDTPSQENNTTDNSTDSSTGN